MLGDELDEVGVLVDREWLEHVLRNLCDLRGGVERQVQLGHGEPVDIAVQHRIGVGGELNAESCRPELAEHGVVMPQVGWTGSSPRLH